MSKILLQIIVIGLVTCLSALAAPETVEQLQARLAAATQEIEHLKARLADSQIAVETAKTSNSPQPIPSADLLEAAHPGLSAYELAILASVDSVDLKSKLKGKVVSLTGTVDRFVDGLGRGFSVILKAEGADRDVICKFYAPPDINSVHTADDGAEMILEHSKRGPILLASIRDEVVITGYFGESTRTRVTLTDCVLSKK